MNRSELTRGIYIVLIAAMLVIFSAVLLAFVLPEPEWAIDPVSPPISFGELLLKIGAVGAVGAAGAIVLMAVGTRLIARIAESRRRRATFRRLGGPSWSERVASAATTGTIIADTSRSFGLFRRFRRASSSMTSPITEEPADAPRRRGLRLFTIVGIAAAVIIASAYSLSSNAPAPEVAPTPIATPTVEPSPTPTPTPEPSPSDVPSPAPSESAPPSPSPETSVTPKPSVTSAPSAPAKITSYVVRAGDTVYSIACKLPIGCAGWEKIATINSLSGPDYLIAPGEILQIP